MTRTFTLTEEELEGLLAAAEYSKRAESHVQEIQNCVYMQRVLTPVAETIDRLRKELHGARFTPDPESLKPLSSRGANYLLSVKEEVNRAGVFPYHVCPETTELRLKKYIEPGMQCVFEKWGSEKQYRPTPNEAAFYRYTTKAIDFIKATLGDNYEQATRN